MTRQPPVALRSARRSPAAPSQHTGASMQIFAIVVSLAIAAVGIALFVQAIRSIIADDQDRAAGRRPQRRQGRPLGDACSRRPWATPGCCSGPRSASAHWFVFVGFGLLFFTLVTAFGQLFDAALRAAADRALLPLRVGLRALHRRLMLIAIVGLHRLPRHPPRGAQPRPPRAGSSARRCGRAYFVEVGHPRRRPVHPGAARRRVRHRAVRRRPPTTRSHYPFTFWHRRGCSAGCRESRAGERRSTWSRWSRSSSRSPG